MFKFKRSAGWSFPGNDDGQVNGLNDPGIETFKDNPLTSLARELLQNSSDAADASSQRPVEVHIQRLEIPSSEFPGLADFKKSLQACSEFWKSSKSTLTFFKNALDVLAQPTLPILKISDFNTTGLVVGANGDRTSDWFKLTKSVGASDKNAGKLGSFGIGKHAPFACSDLRTVFYGTKDHTGATAFQGVAKLVSHKRDRQTTQGTGYFGIKTGNKPILDFDSVSPIFERKKTGADVYVVGFHPFEEWEAKVIKSVIESFFVAIHNGTLIVKVGKTTLNKTSLPEQIKKRYAQPDPHFFADTYYQALTSEEAIQFTEENFHGLGKVTLRILENKEFRKKVAMFRLSGMKIFDKGHFQTPLRFAGVFTVDGHPLDAHLRTMEPPSHSAWEPERGTDPAVSKKILKEIYSWVNDRVRELGDAESVTELDAEGVSQYLPDEIEDETHGTPQQIEIINEEPATFIDIRIRSTPKNSAPVYDVAEAEQGEDEDAEGTEGGPAGPANDTEGGGSSGGDGSEGEKEKKGGGPDKSANSNKRVDISNIRIYCADPSAGLYRLLFEPKSAEVGLLRVFVIGEVGVEAAPVATFSVNGGPEMPALAEKGAIGPLALPPGQRATINVVLENSLRCALGVSAYAD
jgi:hypothetical protein